MDAFVWWCGDAGTQPILARTLSPCWFDSIATGVLVAVALLCFVLQGLGTRNWRRSNPHVGLTGMAGMEAGVMLLSLLLSIIHLGQLAYCLIYLRDLPFHLAFQTALLGLWTSVAIAQADAASCHAPTTALRPVLFIMVPLYAWVVYSGMALYLGGGGPFPPVYARTQVWNAMMATAFSALAALCAFKQVPPVTPDGYAPLPGDVEAGAAAATSSDEPPAPRTWAALFVDACAYAWPEAPLLRLRVLLCVVLLVAMRVINLAVPITYKRLVDQLAGASTSGVPGERPNFWQLLQPWELLYLAAIFFQGGAGGGITGFVNNLRQWLWIPVSQDAYRRVSLAVFAHVLDLDLSFHLKRKTGEVTKVVDRGTSAIQNVLSTIVFSIAPQVVDMLVAATYLAAALEPWIALIVFITIGSYIPLTIAVTEWRGTFRRTMNTTDNAKSARVTDALLNWETVKYFTNEPLEQRRYGEAIDAYQTAEYSFLSSLNVLNVIQSGIMFLGISSGMLACTAGVARGSMTVGDVVLFLSLMAQLYGPLNFFGTYYRVIQQYMIDMENLLQLLDTSGKVTDSPTAKDLVLSRGDVVFDQVSFAYDPAMTVLKSVSFQVPGGSTVAFVGATGSGKSTLTRLLFRFFDVTGGAITIDGQDVRGVTQSSLRAAIGMVPQDCVLFNDTIRYNIQYGNMAAGFKDVEAAAEAACIHETITTRFPKGYDTVVGERGLRLSGGEKQRVAFARALLKNPPLLVLDEATSALDTITEKRIQSALASSRSSRTTFIVAHRLSTIADADLIVVLKEGVVVEQGSHEQLLDQGGVYAELWSKQAHTTASVDDLARRGGGGSTASLTALAAGGTEAAPAATAVSSTRKAP